jgi:hypothetical protein
MQDNPKDQHPRVRQREWLTRRRAVGGLLLVSAVLTCFAGWLWMASGPRVTSARFEQVKKGMSREEVIRSVGGPPGDYTSGRIWTEASLVISGEQASLVISEEQGKSYELWLCDDGPVVVWFDDRGRAVEVDVEFIPRLETLTERIRRWLGL